MIDEGSLTAKARRIYSQRLEPDLEITQKGKIVAIEVESGDYFLGDTEVIAYDRAAKKYPDKKFAFLRVGSKTTHFVGSF